MKKILFIVLSGLMLSTLFLPVQSLRAEDAKFELKASATMRDILAERTGKRATLRLQGGEDVDGTVTMVGNGLVHVTRLSGKDFYDAVIQIDRINAVIFQARSR